jgi:uncharacterized protein (DUF362 family)
VREGLRAALDLLGGLPQFIRAGDRVLLKPNLNGVEGCTDIALTESLIQMLLDGGAGEVFIAESTFGDARMTEMLFAKTGYAALAEEYSIRLLNLNRSEIVRVKVPRPLVLETVSLAREVFEADKIINLPNMKVHYATAVTIALKNLKGLLVGDEKKHFHEVGLDRAICDLNSVVRPALNIVDAISCMERMGPRGGDIVNLNLLIAGDDPAAVDSVGCAVMGFDVSEVKHLALYVAANAVDLDDVEVLGETIDSVRRPFKKAVLENILPKVFTVHNTNACSACMNALLLSCSLLPETPEDAVDVFLGKMHEGAAAPAGLKVAFGNCCRSALPADIRIPGCPPYPFTLAERLKARAK